ncbi:hypothetical protein LOZ53_005511 [Ophidiomyces ophidiicola]|nr:hypothetical protein LOZ55_000289 [Ophidiomyces ophidiicola]KAI1984305.1 hypothetical protein LOZ53_005511 [Ophidiomyces ophidiicola]KAI1989636.1 hypothetical protein LOZ54_002778 [Ophidiomyces ophidiicola]KAI2003615.1 hypothetical protein LOZ51_000697 [Ophidiomyces ophidiicola]
MVLSPPYIHNRDSILNGNCIDFPSRHPAFPNPDPVPAPVNGFAPGPPKPSITRYGPSLSSSSSTPLIANPSRKRSRAEFHASEDEDSSKTTVQQPSPANAPILEAPIYGEGMTLLNPRTGLAISAESQTGTWLEEKAGSQASLPAIASGSAQPDLPSRKSQRLDASASRWDDVTTAAIQHKLQNSTHDDTFRGINGLTSTSTSSSFNPQNPLIDDATHLLGISWQRVNSEDQDIAAAVRGWEKFINNHFSRFLENAHILLKHRGFNAYLVTADPIGNDQTTVFNSPTNGFTSHIRQPYFYLFNEDLMEGQLVGKGWDACLNNLRSSPIIFEAGSEVMKAVQRTPERLFEDKGMPNGIIAMNGNGIHAGNAGMDMGMDIDV